MKIVVFVTLLFCSLAWSIAGEPPPQRTKSSAVPFKIEDEVKDFYLHLVDTNPSVQKTMASLILKACDSSDDVLESSVPAKGPSETRDWFAPETNNHYATSQPRVVAWFPGEFNGDVKKFNDEQSYLVIVAVSQSYHRGGTVNGALVAEFRAVHTGTTKLNKAETEVQVISNKITLTFLGFRQFKLNPIQHPR
jgi:hypothetical protein